MRVYVDPRVDVLSQNQLIALLQLLPSLSLALNGNGGGLIDAIVMTPAEGALRIELKGNLAAILGATVQSKRATETEALSLQVEMVAGARNPLNLEFSRTAA